jgi:SnoaL-like protein
MRIALFVIGVSTLATVACQGNTVRGGLTDSTLRDSLVALIARFDRPWEPQRMSESDAVQEASALLLPDSSFAMVIDTTYYSSFGARAAGDPARVARHRRDTREAHHTNTAIRFRRLGADAAVITQLYRYEFIKVDGRSGFANSAATFVFINTADGWRIAQYHGSHGPQRFTDSAAVSQ